MLDFIISIVWGRRGVSPVMEKGQLKKQLRGLAGRETGQPVKVCG
jgi:hypothetical protein